MSYASVAAHNAPPLSQQPKPDTALLQTEVPPVAIGIADDAQKVNVVGPEFKNHPTTVTSETQPLTEQPFEEVPRNTNGSAKPHRSAKARAQHDLHAAEQEANHLWALAKEQLLRPGVAGGLVGVVNVGLISWGTYTLYTRPALLQNTRFMAISGASVLAILGAEGALGARYANTPRGREEARRAKEEGSAVYRNTKEVVLRPGVLGGIVGVVNLGVLGTVGWFAWSEWDRRTWDRRVVSAVSVGLLTLWCGEGFLAEKYRESHH